MKECSKIDVKGLKDKDNEIFLAFEGKVFMSKEEVIEILKTLEGLKRKLQPLVKE
jgi:hypothetical protein